MQHAKHADNFQLPNSWIAPSLVRQRQQPVARPDGPRKRNHVAKSTWLTVYAPNPQLFAHFLLFVCAFLGLIEQNLAPILWTIYIKLAAPIWNVPKRLYQSVFLVFLLRKGENIIYKRKISYNLLMLISATIVYMYLYITARGTPSYSNVPSYTPVLLYLFVILKWYIIFLYVTTSYFFNLIIERGINC